MPSITARLPSVEAPLLPRRYRLNDDRIETKAISKMHWRLLPLTAMIVVVVYMDRGVLGFVAVDLCSDLSIGHMKYGLVVALFGLGCICSQVPSNYLLRKCGGKVWFSSMLITWGVVAALSAFVQDTYLFYFVRFFLGIIGGGAFPAVCYYLSLFYPPRCQTYPYATLGAAIAISTPIISPVAVELLSFNTIYGTPGWRVLLLLNGLIPFIVGLLTIYALPSTPERTSFLNSEEKTWIGEQQRDANEDGRNLFKEICLVFGTTQFWIIVVCAFVRGILLTAAFYWTTLIIKEMEREDSMTTNTDKCGFSSSSHVSSVGYTSVPFSLAAVLVLAFGRVASNVNNRPRLAGWTLASAGIFLGSWVLFHHSSFLLALLLLSLSVGCFMSPNALIVGLVGSLFDKETRATAVAILNSVEGVGMIGGPMLIGYVVETEGYDVTIAILAVASLLAGFALFLVKDPLATRSQSQPTDDSLINLV